jgi:RNA polymerase subunit RPABC4/transcription elongation factor Spt4
MTFHKWSADCIYYESNQGGDWIPNAFKAYPEIPTREAHSSKGKITRAEPVSGLFERGLCHMVGNYAELEDQLCIMRPNEKSTGHDDRADAMVHAIYGLGLIPRDSWTDAYSQVRCTNCERLYNKNNKSCQHCGTRKEEIIEAPKVINQRNSWAEAYYEICRKCGAKNAKNKMCPNCNPDFGAYMAQVAKLSGNSASGWGYAGRGNWLGRKI